MRLSRAFLAMRWPPTWRILARSVHLVRAAASFERAQLAGDVPALVWLGQRSSNREAGGGWSRCAGARARSALGGGTVRPRPRKAGEAGLRDGRISGTRAAPIRNQRRHYPPAWYAGWDSIKQPVTPREARGGAVPSDPRAGAERLAGARWPTSRGELARSSAGRRRPRPSTSAPCAGSAHASAAAAVGYALFLRRSGGRAVEH